MQDIFLTAISFTPFFVAGMWSGCLFRVRALLVITVMEVALCIYLMSGAPTYQYSLVMTASTIALVFITIVAGQWIGYLFMEKVRKHDP